jgi:hypothetical protein
LGGDPWPRHRATLLARHELGGRLDQQLELPADLNGGEHLNPSNPSSPLSARAAVIDAVAACMPGVRFTA